MSETDLVLTDDQLRIRLSKITSGDPELANEFFRDFTFHRDLQIDRNYRDAYNKIIVLLQKIKSLNPDAYNLMHKGAVFYWAAICAYQIYNFQQAVYLFDAAVSEDIRNDKSEITPAKLFIVLDGNHPDQAARGMTQIAEQKLGDFIDFYNSNKSIDPISVSDIRARFLKRAITDKFNWRTQATSFISFLLEWDYLYVLQEIRGGGGTWEPFFMHLFKGCVLFESLLKANPTVYVTETQLGGILNTNSSVRKQLNISRNIVTSNVTFADLVANIPNANVDMQTNIEFVARLRNAIGHNIGWDVPITSNTYIKMVTIISVVCLHTLSKLY